MASIEIRHSWYDEFEREGRGHRVTIVGDDDQAAALRARLLRLNSSRIHGTGWTFEHPGAGVSDEEWARSLIADAIGADAASLIDFEASRIERRVDVEEPSNAG